MGGLWRADRGLCAAVGFEIKAETMESPCEWQSLEQGSKGEALGNLNWGKTVRKNHLKMSFDFQSPIPDNSSAADTMDVNLIIAKAQEQLCLPMKAQQHENSLRC